FPDGQGVGFGSGIAVFERQHCLFGQYRVNDRKWRLVFRDVLQRNIAAVIPALTVLIVQNGVTVGKRTAAGILTGNANGVATGNQRSERQVLTHAPIKRGFAAHHSATVVEQTVHQRVHCKALGYSGDFFTDALQFSQRHRGVGLVSPFGREERRPVSRVLVLEIRQDRLNGALPVIQNLTVVLHHLIGLFRLQHALRDEFVSVELAGARVLANALVHERLGQRGGVLFVVAQLA